MYSEGFRHKIPSSEGHQFFSLLSAYVFHKKKKKAGEEMLAPLLGLQRTSPLLSRAM